MDKEAMQQEIRKAILLCLYNKNIINKQTYIQALKAIVNHNGREVTQ